MKRRKSQRWPHPSRGAHAGKQTKDRRLVAIDQEPLRRAANSECRLAMARLEKARVEWRRFDAEDKPAFARWMAATFGALLTRLRENEACLGEKRMLIEEVELEVVWNGGGSYRAAYARVMRRRASPPAQDAPASASTPPGEGDAAFEEEEPEPIDRFEQELLFEEFVRLFTGLDPDRFSDAKYEKMFADFNANVFDRIAPEPLPAPPSPRPRPEQSRLKEIYRALVRRLHPDARADGDAAVSAFWHEVQEAYSAGNLERLEMLLALTDLEANTAGSHTSLFQMRAVLGELRRAFAALQKSLRAAKKEVAWNFARLLDRAALQARVQRQLEGEIAAQQRQLTEMETLLAQWSSPPKRAAKRAPRNQQEFSW